MDINIIRQTPEIVRESQRLRKASVEVVDEIIDLDKDYCKSLGQLEKLRGRSKKLQVVIGMAKKKQEEPPMDVYEEKKSLDMEIDNLSVEVARLQIARDALIDSIGNLVYDPTTDCDVDECIREWKAESSRQTTISLGSEATLAQARPHHELLRMIGGFNSEKGSQVAGHRGYYLTGVGVMLNQALLNYGLQFLSARGHSLVQPPLFLNKKIMAKVAQLSQFDQELYHLDGDKYLIATSEQPLCALHADEWMHPGRLPMLYAGISTCFRKEAGAHNKDNWGVFRVHQFEKIEQFAITTPEKSWEMHEKMISTAEEFYQSLGLSYRVVKIASSDLNNAAAKKYDLEAWFPAHNDHRELVSCSNCTDYQSRRLKIRLGAKVPGKPAQHVHMLNSTLVATQRTLCCILENYQTPTGIKVPTVLQPFLAPYLDDPTFIPFLSNQ